MKFDKVIMNPPYGKTLPKKIVLEVMNFINDNGEIVDLQPDSSFVNITEIDKLSTEISKNVINYTKINKKDASKLFGAGFASDLGIFKISKAGRKKNILRYEKLLPIYKKLKTVKSWRASCKIKKRNAKYNLPMQGGNGFYKGMGLDHKGLLKGDPEARLVFKSEQCMNNFLNSLDCWPYKLVYILDDGNAVPAHSPFMQDYTQPWTNERFYKYFNITEEEQKIIEETMAQYETN